MTLLFMGMHEGNHVSSEPTIALPASSYRRVFIWFSNQVSFDQALGASFKSPNLDNLVAGRCQQRTPVLLRAFACQEVGHHDHIQSRAQPVSPLIRYHILIDQELTVAFYHTRSKVHEDLFDFGIRPVV